MKNHLTKIVLMHILILATAYSYAQQAIAQPYYGTSIIRFYNKDNPVAASPCYTLDLSADITTHWGTMVGINDVVIYQGKLFVSIDNGNGEGGVLVYNYADVYPSKTAGPVSVINPQNATGLPVAGIAIQPGSGNLFVGTFYTGASDAGIYTYTASSGYANSSATQLASYYNDNSIDKYIANLAFDASGNLWFTEFDSAAYPNQFLVVYPGANKAQYREVTNPPTKAYTATPASGAGGTAVYLLSQPEGIVFDAGGNLWLANNNDDYGINTGGTLVKINASWIIDTFLHIQATYSTTVPAHSTTVEYIPNGKLGGMLLDVDTLYINDQGQNQGTSYTSSGTVWKWTLGTPFNITNFAASGIYTTYPGNGLMALDNPDFSVASDCYPPASSSSEKNILTFAIAGQVGSSLIDTVHATVTVVMPYGTNPASLTPAITLSPGATISPLSGVGENFTAPFTYTVTAANNSTKAWTVTVTIEISGISGIGQSANAVSLYPNPATGSIFINAAAPAAVEIYNITGGAVQHTYLDNKSIEVNTSSYAAGIYFARLQFADGSYTTEKFIKE